MDVQPLWRRIRRYVISGRETPKVDLKQTLDLSDRPKRAEFVKDVTAIANTPGGDGFLIIGVLDASRRPSDNPEDYIIGFQSRDPDALHRQMIDALTYFCDRVPDIDYEEIEHPETGRHIGVVIIKRSSRRPHSFIKDCGKIKQNDVYIRRGTATYRATPEEIIEMAKGKALPPVIVINLSAHPLTEEQKAKIETEVYIEELIEYPLHFDAMKELRPQIEKAIEEIGLTLEEWSTKSLYLIPPGIAPGAAALLAYIHGLRGGFPKVAWIYQDPIDRTRYIVAQTINLQELRDAAREARTQDFAS